GFGGNTELGIVSIDSAGFDLRAPAERIVAGASLTRDLVNGLKIGDITLSGITAQLPSTGALSVTRIGIDGIG
ncbi:hypothetical protein ACSTHL_23330, partial [Vibrio parahaemolyticus]